MYRNLIWDLDGTLFDTYPAIAGAFRTALLGLGCKADVAWVEGLATCLYGVSPGGTAADYHVRDYVDLYTYLAGNT